MEHTIEDKEILVEELEEHIAQVLECSRVLGNPFIDIPHPVVFNATAGHIYYMENGDFYEPDGVDEYKTAAMLDEMMREIVDLK